MLASGYSGADTGKNNPDMQDVRDIGPIPQGFYEIEAPIDSSTHGPYAMALVPDVANTMFDRSEFMIHGDGIHNPGHASEGCIILPRFAREQVWQSGDHRLQVVKELEITT
jgi:hypothetical protein